MVGYDERQKELTTTQYAVAGCASGVITRLLLQPLDVAKIRLQIQLNRPEKTLGSLNCTQYRGLFQTLNTIVLEEGAQALWKGHIPAQLLSVSYGCVQFVSFEALTKLAYHVISPQQYSDFRPVTYFICGGLAGCCSSLVVQPIDVLRTRLVAQREPKVYVSLFHAVHEMYAENGIRTFYKGLMPTMLEIFPQTGMHFAFYTGLQMIWKKCTNSLVDVDVSATESLVCGAMSGIFSKIIIHPLDVVKKRLQIKGFAFQPEIVIANHYSNNKSTSMVSCIKNIIKYEGYGAFYKGLKVNVIKGASSVAITFMTYEQFCKFLMSISN